MTSKFFNAKEIIALHEKYNKDGKYGNLFDIDVTKVASSKSKTKCFYIPLLINNFDGSKCKLKLKIVNQLLMSNAKVSPYAEENKSKDIGILYRELTNEDLEKSDYQNTTMNNLHNNLLNSSKEFIKANDIICNEFKALVENKIYTYRGAAFQIKNKKLSSYRQEYRNLTNDEKGKTDEELGLTTFETPEGIRVARLKNSLFRYKIPVEQEEPYRIGYYRTEGKSGDENAKKKFEYVVFDHDANKKTANGWIKTPAKILKNNKPTDLDINTIGLFVSYLSLSTGIASFDSVILSSQGISLKPKIYELTVKHHKRAKKEYIADDEYNSMDFISRSMKKSDEDENDLSISNEDEEKLKSSNKINVNSSNENEDDLNENTQIDEPDENHEVTKPDNKTEKKDDSINAEIEQKITKTVNGSKHKSEKSNTKSKNKKTNKPVSDNEDE
jgi:hypothetical protein